MGLDLDRGVMIRVHKSSGMKVAMYFDEPGTYYSEGGDVLDVKFAKDAGFDVKKHMIEAVKKKRLEEFEANLNRELADEDDRLAMALSSGSEYDVRHVGGGQYAIFDADGVRVIPATMSKADVELLIGRKVDVPHEGNAEATE